MPLKARERGFRARSGAQESVECASGRGRAAPALCGVAVSFSNTWQRYDTVKPDVIMVMPECPRGRAGPVRDGGGDGIRFAPGEGAVFRAWSNRNGQIAMVK